MPTQLGRLCGAVMVFTAMTAPVLRAQDGTGGGAGGGAITLTVARLELGASATGSLLKLVSGVLSDRTRAMKSWVVAGYALAAISRPLFALARSWPVVLVRWWVVGRALQPPPSLVPPKGAVRPLSPIPNRTLKRQFQSPRTHRHQALFRLVPYSPTR